MKYLVILDRKKKISGRTGKDRAEAGDSKLDWHKTDESKTCKHILQDGGGWEQNEFSSATLSSFDQNMKKRGTRV